MVPSMQGKRSMARHGIVATCTLSHMPDMKFRGILEPTHGYKCEIETNKQLEWGMLVISFLYAIRKPYAHHQGCCRVEFPPCNSHMSNKCDNHLTIFDVINCFSHGRGEFPRIFPEFVVMTDADENMNLDHVYRFLRNAVYLGINGNPFVEWGLEFIKAVLKEATNLEVLLLDHWGKEDAEWKTELEPKCFDEFCAYLYSNKAFCPDFDCSKFSLQLNQMSLLFHERILTSSSRLTLRLPLIMCRNSTLLIP